MKKAILLSNDTKRFFLVYSNPILNQIKDQVDLYDQILTKDNINAHLDITRNTNIIFSTWGMPSFTEEEITDIFPNLQILFYAAGSVRSFAEPFIKKGVKVVSSYAANTIPTAEYAACQIILANKGYFQAALRVKHEDYHHSLQYHNLFPGNYQTKVGILGAGMVGSQVIHLLKVMNLNVDILVFDPYLSEERANMIGVKKVNLVEIFSTCQTISNHIANIEATKNMFHKEHFDLMLETATFINTGRGEQIVEADLIQALKEVPTRTAVLDVTYPEPPKPNSALYQLENVILTPHIAGSKGNELYRMASYSIEELNRWLNHEDLKYLVTKKMLETMA